MVLPLISIHASLHCHIVTLLGRVIGPAGVIGCASLRLRRSLGFAVISPSGIIAGRMATRSTFICEHSRKFVANKSVFTVFIRGKKYSALRIPHSSHSLFAPRSSYNFHPPARLSICTSE